MTADDSNFAQLSEGLGGLGSFLEIDYWQLKELQGSGWPGPAHGVNELRAIGSTLELLLQPSPAF